MHRSKRPYAGSQPSITCYFSPSTTTTRTANTVTSIPMDQHMYNSQSAPAQKSTPTLPAAVQSSLLNVGMRVRKSVPEGYKTGTDHSAFGLFSNYVSHAPMADQEKDQKRDVQTTRTRPRAGERELMPFCGILKVGGLAQQQWGTPDGSLGYSDGATVDDWENLGLGYVENGMERFSKDEEKLPCLCSQSSTISASSEGIGTKANGNGASNKKRRFLNEGDALSLDLASWTSMSGKDGTCERALAVTKKKSSGVSIVTDVVTANRVPAVGQEIDFEDAEFLDYGLGGSDTGEVEMSG